MLPTVMPMLATSGEPFDSPKYRFEIKWDGIRALAAIDATGWHLWGRDLADYTLRYPELAVLRDLPPGTLVDGELVVRGPPATASPQRSMANRPGLALVPCAAGALRYLVLPRLQPSGRTVTHPL